MAKAIITMKLMPESPEVDLIKVEENSKKVLEQFEGKMQSAERQPIGFGLVALILKFVVDEKHGTDAIESEMCKIEGVESAQTTMTSRAMG
ncbi:elongation factor 1-beta [Candidatus Woesearchaeota archaeon]|nr:elongation factor 1-beta [Candidatus Woesearchaeota archaeon]